MEALVNIHYKKSQRTVQDTYNGVSGRSFLFPTQSAIQLEDMISTGSLFARDFKAKSKDHKSC